jgi:glycoprotein endo-alpha-1,2-mannosidase
LRFLYITGLLTLIIFSFGVCSKDNSEPVNEDQPCDDTWDPLSGEYTLGVYYYPWHHGDFHGAEYLRKYLIPSQQPVLGEYDDRDASTLKAHFDWCRYAGISVLSCSWWGPGSGEDITTKDYMLKHTDLGDLKICLHYETAGMTNNFTSLANVGPDITYIAENYFDHPNYYKIDCKPVIVVYLTRVLQYRGMLDDFVQEARNSASNLGYDLYIIGDHAFGSAPGFAGNIDKLDAITNYDVYGSTGVSGYAGLNGATDYTADQADWRDLAHSSGIGFVPAVSPGFNDKGVRDGHEPLSRKLTGEAEFGSLFTELLRGAKPLADTSSRNLIMITSWNEWHEDTQIEPVMNADSTNRDVSSSGYDYTTGLEYQGYDSLYLNILRDEFTPE